MSPIRGIRVERLSKEHDRGKFSCGAPSLDNYLARLAGHDLRRRISTTYVAVREGESTILGYYSLAATAIDVDRFPEALGKKLPRHPVVPATLLARLAVDIESQGLGLGEVLLTDALWRSLELSRQVASMAVVVDAINDAAKRFYERYGFAVLSNEPMRLYVLMAAVEKEYG